MGAARRAWNAADHPRGPGGKFVSGSGGSGGSSGGREQVPWRQLESGPAKPKASAPKKSTAPRAPFPSERGGAAQPKPEPFRWPARDASPGGAKAKPKKAAASRSAYKQQGQGTPAAIARYKAMDHATLRSLADQHGLISENRSVDQLADALADNAASRRHALTPGATHVETTRSRRSARQMMTS